MTVLCLLLLVLPGTGCWDANAPEQIAWVSALGVDPGPGENFLFTFQVVIPNIQPTGAPGRRGGRSALVFSLAAPDVVTALEMSGSFVARRLNMQHAKALVMGEGIGEQGTARFLAPAVRFREFRRSMNLLVVRGTAKAFLNLVRPTLEANPAFWFEVMTTYQSERRIVPPARIHDFVMAGERPGMGARAMLVAPRPDIAEADLDPTGVPPQGTPPSGASTDVFAGEIFRVGEVPVEILGSAVFNGGRLVGYLTGRETRLVSMLRGELTQRTQVTVPDPGDPETRVVLMMQARSSPQTKVIREGTQVRAEFVLPLEGDIASIPSNLDYTTPDGLQRLQRATERYFQAEMAKVLQLTLRDWGTDLYDLGDQVRPTFLSLPQWEAFRWADRVRQVTYSVRVVFSVRRHGQQLGPTKLRQ